MIQERFKDKIAIITGSAGGIGKAIAFRLGREGGFVALFDYNEVSLQETVREFKQQGIRAKGYVLNIAQEEQIISAVNRVAEEFGRIDIMVNSAGIVGPTSTKITDYPTDEFDRIYEINLKGSFLITKYVLREMIKTGNGRILLIASISGKEGNPGMVGYSSTKAGVIGLVKGV